MAVFKNRFFRLLIFTIGILSVAIGAIGIFVPMLPTTPFILLAAWSFLKSSEVAHNWIYRQPFFGKALNDWEKNRAISKANKTIAISMIFLSLVFIWIKVNSFSIRSSVTIFLFAVSTFILTRNETEK
jgi:uncharacterized membrane protein YbaN (DUF454 family)